MKKQLYLIMAIPLFLSCDHENKTQTPVIPRTDSISKEAKQDTVTTGSQELSANRMIIPGKTIGLVSINETSEEVDTLLGKPDKGDAAMGKSLFTWYSKPVGGAKGSLIKETNIFFSRNMGAVDEASRVQHIRVTSPFFITTEGIGVGAGFSAIKQYYPQIKKTAYYTSQQTKGSVFIYDDIEAGIAFEMDHKDNCIAVTVHEPGKKAFDIYLAFFPDLKFY